MSSMTLLRFLMMWSDSDVLEDFFDLEAQIAIALELVLGGKFYTKTSFPILNR